MKTEIYLIRHGQSTSNLTRIFTGQVDADLTELGKAQARATAEFLKDKKIEAVYSSCLKRAYETAEPIAENIGLRVIPIKELNEHFFGSWGSMSYDEVKEKYPLEYDAFKNDIGIFKAPEGESSEDVRKRVSFAAEKIIKETEGKKIAIATPGIVIKSLLTFGQNKPITEMKNEPVVTNGSVTIVEYENGEYRIVLKGADEHLKELKTDAPKL